MCSWTGLFWITKGPGSTCDMVWSPPEFCKEPCGSWSYWSRVRWIKRGSLKVKKKCMAHQNPMHATQRVYISTFLSPFSLWIRNVFSIHIPIQYVWLLENHDHDELSNGKLPHGNVLITVSFFHWSIPWYRQIKPVLPDLASMITHMEWERWQKLTYTILVPNY